MKATDLMIGDWVYNTLDNAFEQVIELGEKQVMLRHRDIYDYHEIEPIPITPEILKKNGFVYADLPFEDFYEGYGLHIHGGNYADGHNNLYITCGINMSMNVTHVHELQHALRLCGIDKEITI